MFATCPYICPLCHPLYMGRIDGKLDMYEGMDDSLLGLAMNGVVRKAVSGLAKVAGAENASSIYLTILVSSISIDGEINETEYELVRDIFSEMVGREVTIDELRASLAASDLGDISTIRSTTANLIRSLGAADPTVRDDVLELMAMFCAMDHKVTPAERNWLLELESL